MFKFLGKLFGSKKPARTYTIEINGVQVTAPVGVRIKYRRKGNARPVSGNAKKAA